MLRERIKDVLIGPTATVYDAIAAIDRGGVGIAILVDERQRLLGTITDGDVRRSILHGVKQSASVMELLAYRAPEYREPTVAELGTPLAQLYERMRAKAVRQIPLLDAERRVVDLVVDSELSGDGMPGSALIMAGGFGERLRPLTADIPKPMLRVGGRPLLERIIQSLGAAGIRRVTVATHYRDEVIREYFGDGSVFGVELSYVKEDEPLGTAGALRLIERPTGLLLVMNGDILTRLNFRLLADFHQEGGGAMTVAVRRYDIQVPYGVVDTDGANLTRLVEKPVFEFFVSAGVYLLQPDVYDRLPAGRRFDMTEVIEVLLRGGNRVTAFPIREYWLDIGRLSDLAQAQEDVGNGRA